MKQSKSTRLKILALEKRIKQEAALYLKYMGLAKRSQGKMNKLQSRINKNEK